MQVIVTRTGQLRAIYDEALDFAAFGPAEIRRASHVEPDSARQWWADLSPVAGPVLGPFAQRSAALAAEIAWLAEHWLASAVG